MCYGALQPHFLGQKRQTCVYGLVTSARVRCYVTTSLLAQPPATLMADATMALPCMAHTRPVTPATTRHEDSSCWREINSLSLVHLLWHNYAY